MSKNSTITMFTTVNIYKYFTIFMGTFMTYVSTNFHITKYHKMESRMKNSLQLPVTSHYTNFHNKSFNSVDL